MTKRFAFTLAEVLIALAIIGVVAAMTIPTFMANTAGAQFKTGIKKTIAVLTTAAAANYATEGYDFGTANASASYTATTHDAATDGHAVIGFDTTPSTDENDDLGRVNSLFHIFQNNLNLKNSKEVEDYAVAGTPVELSCAGRGEASFVGSARVTGVKAANDVPENMHRGGIRNLCNPANSFNQGRMFQMEDGSVFTWDATQAYCTESVPCYGYIDVNGSTGPNRVVGCSAVDADSHNDDAFIPSYGRNANEDSLQKTCTVEAKDITDIYPVVFYNSTVKPATLAAKAVLYNTKSNQTAAIPANSYGVSVGTGTGD